MSTAAAVAGAFLDFGLDSLQSFTDPGVTTLVAAGLETIDYAWDEGERALGQVLEAQEAAIRQEEAAKYLVQLQKKLDEVNNTFDQEVARLQKELDDAQAEGIERVRQVEEKFESVLVVMQNALDTQQKIIENLKLKLNKR